MHYIWLQEACKGLSCFSFFFFLMSLNSPAYLIFFQGRDVSGCSPVSQATFPISAHCLKVYKKKMVSEPWASSGAWPCQEKFREALPLSSRLQCGACILGWDNIGSFLQGSSVSLFLCWEIFCFCFEKGSKNTTRKLAVNYSPGNNKKAKSSPKHLEKWVHVLVTWSLLLTPCFLQCAGPHCEQHVGCWSAARYFVRLMCWIHPMDSSESPARGL